MASDYCTECDERYSKPEQAAWAFCPFCGTELEEKDQEDE